MHKIACPSLLFNFKKTCLRVIICRLDCYFKDTIFMKNLDQKLLEKLAQMQFLIQQAVDGTMSGIHKSPLQGQSIEFSQHKEYSVGDELRHLDWKVMARTDKHYIKRFQFETNINAYCILDASQSMAYGNGAKKIEYGKLLLGAIAYMLNRQQDSVGVLAIPGNGKGEHHSSYLPCSSDQRQMQKILSFLVDINCQSSFEVISLMQILGELLSKRSLLILASDLFDMEEKLLNFLIQLKQQGHTIIIFHILHPTEISFPFDMQTRFVGMENEQEITTFPRTIRNTYLEEFNQFLEFCRLTCLRSNIKYHRFSTTDSLEESLLKFLAS